MTPDEHEAQRRTVWIEAMKATLLAPVECEGTPTQVADEILAAFDSRFPAPKSEDEG